MIWLFIISSLLLSFFSTFLDPDTRRQMGEQAVMLAKSVGYSSAGWYSYALKIISSL